MRIVLLLILVCSVQAAPRLRRSIVESLEIEVQLDTMTDAEKTEQIHFALGHDHRTDPGRSGGALEEVLKTGSYPKPMDHQTDRESKTTEELITQYIEAEPSNKPLAGSSFLSKGSNQNLGNGLQQPSTLGVQGWKAKAENSDEKKKKEDTSDDDEKDGGTKSETEADVKNDPSSSFVPTPTPGSASPVSEAGMILQGLHEIVYCS